MIMDVELPRSLMGGIKFLIFKRGTLDMHFLEKCAEDFTLQGKHLLVEVFGGLTQKTHHVSIYIENF